MTANNISDSLLKSYIIKSIGNDTLTLDIARKHDISDKEFANADKDENNYVGLEEMLKNTDLRSLFKNRYLNEIEDNKEVKDKEKEKKEQT